MHYLMLAVVSAWTLFGLIHTWMFCVEYYSVAMKQFIHRARSFMFTTVGTTPVGARLYVDDDDDDDNDPPVDRYLTGMPDVYASDQEKMDLIIKKRHGSEEKVMEFFDRLKYPINYRDSKTGRTLLFYVATNSRSYAHFLLNKGADPNIQDNAGNTVLHVCTADIGVTFTLFHVTDLSITNHQGLTAMQCNRYAWNLYHQQRVDRMLTALVYSPGGPECVKGQERFLRSVTNVASVEELVDK